MESKDLYERYHKDRLRKIIFTLVFVLLTFTLFWFSLAVGTRNLPFEEVYRLLFAHINGTITSADAYDDRIVWDFRLPRTFLAIVVGAILAISGSVMQSVMKNPLADPYTTGVSSGAVFGVAIATILGFSVGNSLGSNLGIVINSVIFAMIPVLVIIVMSPFFRKSPSTLILTGVATSYLFSSLTSILMVTTDSETLSQVYHWEIGNLAELGWTPVYVLTVVLIIGAGVLWPLSNKLNLMSLDDKDAKALGLDGENLRKFCLVLLCIMTACVIAFTGIIGFIGLVIPHIIRIILGSDNKFLLPASMAFGAFFLLFCDMLARWIDVGATIPIGVITSFIGAPIFLFLIVRQKKGIW